MGKGRAKAKARKGSRSVERKIARHAMAGFEAARDTRRTAGWWGTASGPNGDLRQACIQGHWRDRQQLDWRWHYEQPNKWDKKIQ